MGILILKSAACLAILMVFYKLLLEHLAIHKFKRFYLLGALVVSIVIPFITFIEYIEPNFEVPYFNVNHSIPLELLPIEKVIEAEPINYLPIILWSLYSIGVLLFASKFCINLFGIVSKINKNEKQKHSNFISVLLNDLIVPHTFFSYIFLNKTRFETKTIPQEVLLHEQTHAIQKHTLDILFIELLQIVFWFNPLLYFIKKDIKLNHEFLADEAVLKQGIDSSTYQNTLLQFTSNANEIPLAHAINYSLIKKRFTIMKTQTSKKAVWLRSLLLLPLLGGLLFSFSSRELVEKEVVPAMLFPEEMENSNALTNVQEDTLKINYVLGKEDYYKNATFKFRDKNKKIIAVKSYDELSDAQKKRLLPPPTKPMQRQPSKKQLNAWQNASQFGVWLDGKQIKNSKLKNIPSDNLAHYFESKLEKNAKNYGKHYYQINLYSLQEFTRLYNATIKPLKEGTEILIYENEKTLQKTQNGSVNHHLSNVAYTQNETPLLIVNGIVCDKCELNLSKKGVENIILATTTDEHILSFNIKVPKKPTVHIYGNGLNTKATKQLNSASLGTVIHLFDIITVNKQKLAPITIKLVDKNAKNYSHSPIVKKGEKSSLPPPPPPAPNKEYNKMRAKTNLPPPPPPPAPPKPLKDNHTGFININGQTHFFAKVSGKTKYYNRYGIQVDKKGNKLSNTQTDGSQVIPGQKISKIYKDNKVVSEFKKTWKGDEGDYLNIPEPPRPPAVKSAYQYIQSSKNDTISYFYNNKSISYKEALMVTQKEPNINMYTHVINGTGSIHFNSINRSTK